MAAAPDSIEVLVIGGGLAALCAAISAREAGASVLMAEAAPREFRGGNTRHSRNLRIVHDAPSPSLPGSYSEAEFMADLAKASQGACDEALASLMSRQSASLPAWLASHGVVFQTEHIPYSRKTAFFLGGGMAALNALYAKAERLGVRIVYGQPIDSVQVKDGAAWPYRAGAIVACCGGEQANTAPLGYINRGTPFAKGEVLRSLISQGAAVVGSEEGAHLVAVDARFAGPDGGIVTRVDGMEYGMAVDHAGRRFQDETAIKGPTRYSDWGRLIARLPERRAALILDADGFPKIPAFALPPLNAPSLADLASQLGADAQALEQSAKDSGRVARPPLYAFPMRPGIAFTCLGVKIDGKARVLRTDGAPLAGLFAAGMIMAPNVLGTGYVAGCGMTIGAVFGRIAGEEAARHVLG
jgi:tricarballylate dehydrogenase